MNLSQNAIKILEKRYLRKDEDGNIIETPEQMINRITDYVCEDNEVLKQKAKQLMLDLKFLPNTPTLMNAGITNQLSACFVIPIKDSLESIVHEALWHQAAIHKFGGGTGINFSNLRPKGDSIKNLGVTTGVLSFIRNFDTMSDSIHQGGKRPGANMTILDIHHPEIEDFITAKTNNNKDYENMNFSVLVDNNFMQAVKDNKSIFLSFPVKSDKKRKEIKAKYLFDLICDSAHKCGCPGILFEENLNKGNVLKDFMWCNTTNPCGELILFCGEYEGEDLAESCNLGSFNLVSFVEDNTGVFKFKELEEAVSIATEFLDLVIDKNNYPFAFIEKGTKLTRKIGLGITGFHEMLVKMDISYGSKESTEWAEKVMQFINEESNKVSQKLAVKNGTYPLAHLISDTRRNATTTAIAPTGTIGRFMLGYGHALGIEPPFALCIESKIIESTLSEGIYPPLMKVLNAQGWKKETLETIIWQIKQNGETIQDLVIPDKIKVLFRTASEIPIEQHIAIQAAFQKHTQNAVSKTINMNHNTTTEDVSKAFLLAWKSNLKGITIYRAGSKNNQVLNTTNTKLISELSKNAPTPRQRFKDHIAIIREIESACGITYCGISFDEYGFFEVFPINSGKGGCEASDEERGRTGSTMLRFNIPVETIIKQYGKVKCKVCLTKDKFYDNKGKFIGIKSCSHGLSKQMEDYYSNPNLVYEIIELQSKIHSIFNRNSVIDNLLEDTKSTHISTIIDEINLCPNCKISLIKQEGCTSEGCPNCGYGGCN